MKTKFQLILIALFLSGSMLSAQVLTSKKGIPILPAAGDFCLGISATPILDFAGNLIKINSNNAFSSDAAWSFPGQDQAIYAKYFLEDNIAIRARLRINNSSKKEIAYSIKNQLSEMNPYLFVEDSWIHKSSNIMLSGGLEKRRGYGRLQGFYGAELTLALTGASSDIYSYGNAIDANFHTPDRTNFNNNVQGSSYVKERKTKAIAGFGIGVFAGAEYFILPKISIGGEFGWSIGTNLSNSNGEESLDAEYWGTPPGSSGGTSGVQSVTVKYGKTSFFNIGNSQTGGNLFLLLHF
jgi:hypothetical protein